MILIFFYIEIAYVINRDDKDKIDKFLKQVNDTNNEYNKIKELSVILNNIGEELNSNRNKIKTLTESNDVLFLREENKLLKNSPNQLKNKFIKLIKLIKDKIFSRKDTRDKYMNFSRDLYINGVIDDKEMHDINDIYNKNIEKKGRF